MASLSSSSTSIPPSWLSDTNNITLRDASFSSYLNTTEEDYIRSLVTTKTVQDDGEIDVFSADKYFKGDVDQECHIKPAKYHNEKTFTRLSKLNLQPRTPSIHSESSWNSQSALVRPVQRNSSRRNIGNRVKKSSFLSSCYCCDAKSIDIKVYEDKGQFSNYGDISFNNEFERGMVSRTIKTSFDTSDIARFNKKRIDSSYDTDMFTFPVSDSLIAVNTSAGPSVGTYSDTESDTSSDLFEISVDWSVVTASAADFEEHTSTLSPVSRDRAVPKPSSLVDTRMIKGRQKAGIGGMLSGCKSQKAVEVVEDVYRSSAGNRKFTDSESRKMHRLSDCYSPVTRLQAQGKLPGHGNSFRHSKSFSNSGPLYI